MFQLAIVHGRRSSGRARDFHSSTGQGTRCVSWYGTGGLEIIVIRQIMLT